MYQFSYAEVLEETPQTARQRERHAIEHSIQLLLAAEKAGVRSREAVEALHFVPRLWSVLIEDLAKTENDLPQQLRADLISIGLWIMRESEEIRQGRSENFEGIIQVTRAIAEGLQ
jgi:flagellar protein FlaF